MIIPFYLHNSNDANEIRELLKSKNIPAHLIGMITEQLYGKFYEVGFNVEIDDFGIIKSVELMKKL